MGESGAPFFAPWTVRAGYAPHIGLRTCTGSVKV